MPREQYKPASNGLSEHVFHNFTPSINISKEALEDLTKKVNDLTKAFALLSEQFKLVFGDNVLLDGEFVDYKKLLDYKK